MSGPFKMKGNPMQRNFGSPLHEDKTTLVDKIKSAGKAFKDNILNVGSVGKPMYGDYVDNKRKAREKATAKKSSATPKKTEEQLARMKAADNKVLADRKKKKSVKDKETARRKAAGIATGFTKNELAVQAKRKRDSNIVYND